MHICARARVCVYGGGGDICTYIYISVDRWVGACVCVSMNACKYRHVACIIGIRLVCRFLEPTSGSLLSRVSELRAVVYHSVSLLLSLPLLLVLLFF